MGVADVRLISRMSQKKKNKIFHMYTQSEAPNPSPPPRSDVQGVNFRSPPLTSFFLSEIKGATISPLPLTLFSLPVATTPRVEQMRLLHASSANTSFFFLSLPAECVLASCLNIYGNRWALQALLRPPARQSFK